MRAVMERGREGSQQGARGALGVYREEREGEDGLTSDLWRREDDVLLELLALQHVLLALDNLLSSISVRSRTGGEDLIRRDVHWRRENQRHSERGKRKGKEGSKVDGGFRSRRSS